MRDVRPRELVKRGADHGLDVLGLVVGRKDEPGACQGRRRLEKVSTSPPTMRNAEIADAFEELASLYELDGAVVYRVVAYRNAAKAIREAGVSVGEMARQGRVDQLAGVGKTIAEKIDALLETGSIPSADKLKARIPSGLVAITRIPGLGPKRARLLYEHLGVSSLEELRDGRRAGPPQGRARLRREGGGERDGGARRRRRRSARRRACCSRRRSPSGRSSWPACATTRPRCGSSWPGSARRQADTVKDLDIVVAASDPKALAEHFCSLPAVDVVHTSGEAGAKALTHSGLPVDLRIVPEEAFGNLLQHFTGSGRHNEALRTAGRQARPARERVRDRGRRERRLDRLRHRGGGLRAARHAVDPARAAREPRRAGGRARGSAAGPDRARRTSAATCTCTRPLSDGHASIEEMADGGARSCGYDYVAITEHSATHGFGNDVQPDELLRAERAHPRRSS